MYQDEEFNDKDLSIWSIIVALLAKFAWATASIVFIYKSLSHRRNDTLVSKFHKFTPKFLQDILEAALILLRP